MLESLAANVCLLSLAAIVIGVAGVRLTATAEYLAAQTRLGQVVLGGVFIGASTSLPGTVTSVTAAGAGHPDLAVAIAAVRHGAVNLALGDIVGGNTFDVLFLGFSDIAYRPGSIFHAISVTQPLWIGLCIVMTAVLLLGLLRRERHGFANIGLESTVILLLYCGAVGLLFQVDL